MSDLLMIQKRKQAPDDLLLFDDAILQNKWLKLYMAQIFKQDGSTENTVPGLLNG